MQIQSNGGSFGVWVACELACYQMLFHVQGEDGEAGDPGPVGEPGNAVSNVAYICQLFNFILSLLSLFGPFSDCHCICYYPRVLKVMWERKVTLVLQVLLGLLDPEVHQERMEPKAIL